jgi:hypothetical protein
MDKDTVVIDLSVYNALRDFKKSVEENKIPCKHYWGEVCLYERNYELEFYSFDEVLKILSGENKRLSESNTNIIVEGNKLKKENDYLKQFAPKEKESISIDDLKKMSYWEFRKWKKNGIRS